MQSHGLAASAQPSTRGLYAMRTNDGFSLGKLLVYTAAGLMLCSAVGLGAGIRPTYRSMQKERKARRLAKEAETQSKSAAQSSPSKLPASKVAKAPSSPQPSPQTSRQPRLFQPLAGDQTSPKKLVNAYSPVENSRINQQRPRIIQTSQVTTDAQRRTEIQRQLEALYRRDGREMPPMNLSKVPSTAGQPRNGLESRNLQKIQPPANPQQAQVAQPSNRRVPRFLQRLFPSRQQKPQQLQPQATQQLQPQANQALTRNPAALPQQQPTVQPKVDNAPTTTKPIVTANPAVQKSTGSSQPEPKFTAVAPKQFTLDLAPTTEETKKKPASRPVDIVSNVDEDLDDIFPDGSEEEADNQKTKTPFSGKSLSEARSVANTSKPSPKAPPATEVEEEPTLDEILDSFSPSQEIAAQPASENESDSVATQTPAEKPFAEEIATTSNRTEHDSKIQLIASRSELSGLKGFCIVALRDKRELVNVNLLYGSVYETRTYYFASRENWAKFESNPAKYAPAAGGRDVVVLKHQEMDIEGSLDHAVWYRGRLHLFSSQETLAQFTRNPKSFITD